MVFVDEDQEITVDYQTIPAVILSAENESQIARTKNIWNSKYLLGTDGLGRDMLTRLMFGTRISMIVAFIATFVNMTIGMIYGGISAYAGGMTDIIMMRIVDIISTIPLTLYVILIIPTVPGSSGFRSPGSLVRRQPPPESPASEQPEGWTSGEWGPVRVPTLSRTPCRYPLPPRRARPAHLPPAVLLAPGARRRAS